jgi:hypothetical protein
MLCLANIFPGTSIKRDIYFETIEKLGFEIDNEDLPHEFHTDEWWKKRGL